MEGIATFLLGGALGVALGFLASRKRSQKSTTTMPGRSMETPPVGPFVGTEEPVLSQEAVPEQTDSIATAVLEEVPVEEAVAEEGLPEELLAEGLLAEEPLAKELLTEGVVPEEAAEEAVTEETGGVEEVAEMVATEAAATEAAATEAAATEVLPTEGPWVEEEVIEAPIVEELVGEQALEKGPEAEAAAVVEELEPVSAAAETLLEATAEPAFGSAWEGDAALATTDERVESSIAGVEEEYVPWEFGQVEAESESEEIGEASVLAEADLAEIEFVDLAVFETPVAEAVEVEVTESPGALEETAAAPEVSVEPEAAVESGTGLEGATLTEGETSSAVSPVDDLKARIEETRRRIRRELEQPFVSVDEMEQTQDWTFAPVIPVAEQVVEPQVVEPERVEPEPVEPAMAEFETAEPLVGEFETFEPESASALAEAVSPEETPEEASGEVLDYDSMKSRIEVTRSRLKAKAFDAMMTGESALLGREPEDAQSKRPPLPVVDSEIDQTIETGLREQED